MIKTQIDLSVQVPLIMMYPTKKDLLKAVIPVLEEIYNKPVVPSYSFYETKDFIDYLKELTYEK